MKIFSIYDTKTKDFGMPFFSINEDTAVRSFRDLADDPSTTVSRYPDDFTLFELGDFNRDTGVINGHDKPQTIRNALEIQTPKTAVSG